MVDLFISHVASPPSWGGRLHPSSSHLAHLRRSSWRTYNKNGAKDALLFPSCKKRKEETRGREKVEGKRAVEGEGRKRASHFARSCSVLPMGSGARLLQSNSLRACRRSSRSTSQLCRRRVLAGGSCGRFLGIIVSGIRALRTEAVCDVGWKPDNPPHIRTIVQIETKCRWLPFH
jgi:hypothetical protein